MKLHRIMQRLGFALAVAVAAAIPAFAQDTGATTTTPPATATATDQAQIQAFNLPTVVPMGHGWYGAASTTTQNAMMARGAAWSNDLMSVRGVARVAVIDARSRDMAGAATSTGTPTTGTDRLVTGSAQWMDPSDNSLWEVRFTGINSAGPLGGASVMRVQNGDTGIGFSQFPRSLGYAALDGPVQVLRNGQVVADNLQGHIMVTQGIRAADSGHLLDTASVAPGDIQFHVFVQGNIPARSGDSLYVFWPSATIDIRNLSAPVALLPQEIQVAQAYFTPEGAVAGFRGPTALPASMPLLIVSLRERFLARSTTQTFAGAAELRVRNDSNEPRGFYIQGPGIDQRTNLLNPGEEVSMQITLQPGTYRLASFTRAEPTMNDYVHWDQITVVSTTGTVPATTMTPATPGMTH